MKLKLIFLTVMIASALVLMLSGTAFAQTPCGSVNFVVSPTHGTAGSSFTASGSHFMNSSTVNLFWDGSSLGAGVPVDSAGILMTIVTVPASAPAGVHQVMVRGTFSNESQVQCTADFTVDASVQQTAYATASPAATLPNTGIFLLVPATGLAVGGLGGIMLRRRHLS